MNSENCKHRVNARDVWVIHGRQCSRKAVRDGYCNTHHPDAVEKRRKKSDETFKKRFEQSPSGQLERALKIIKSLRVENARLTREIEKLRSHS